MMPKEEDERIWREFINNGGNLKNQTEIIKKELADRKLNLVEKKKRNLPKPSNLTKRLIRKIATKKRLFGPHIAPQIWAPRLSSTAP